jgi:hypothetical protein
MMKTKKKYQKGLNKNDPFDQLIMELAQKGVLDVCAVEIKQDPSGPETDSYPQKIGFGFFEKNHYFKRVKQ